MWLYRLRNILLGLGAVGCLTFTGVVVHVVFFAAEPVQVPIGGPFELIDHHGAPVTNATFAGRYMLLYFGYTFCPDACPTELAKMTAALDSLAETDPERAEKVVPVFITIDPERDTRKVLGEFRQHFHPRLVTLGGSDQAIKGAAQAYRVYFQKAGNDPDYLMDHSSTVFLMGPDGTYVTHFPIVTTVDQMAAQLAKYVE